MSAMLTRIWPMARSGFTDRWTPQCASATDASTGSRERPVIPSQRGSPASSSSVGATSARTPSSRRRPRAARPTRTNGTGLSEWAVTALPSASRSSSALPWSAVIARSAPGPVGSSASTRLDRRRRSGQAAVDDLERRDGRGPDAGVADHVRVGEVRDDEVVLAGPDRLDQRVGDADGAHLRLRGRTSRPWGSGRAGVPRPGTAASTPPLKKYVTWAYFSVSATWNWRQPASETACGERARLLRREGDLDRQAGLVLGHRHDEAGRVGAGRPIGAARSKPSKSRVGQRVGQLARPVGPEVGVDDGVAVADRRRRSRRSPSAARTRRSRRGRRRPRSPRRPIARMLAHPVDDGVVAALDAVPAVVAVHRRSSGRRPSRSARPDAPPRGARSRSATNPRAERGGVSRPSSRAWTRIDGTPRRAASSARATRCRSLAWTPPGPIRLMRWSRPSGRAARAHASSSAGRSKNEPSAIAASIRGRSWRTGRPAPRFRWPTSELPIWPAGRPTASSEARSMACGQSRQQAAPGRHPRGRDRVGRRVAADPEPVEDDEDDRTRPVRRRRRRVTRRAPRAAAVRPARATMPAISSGLSEAPPTSAPSIAGSARNSPMLAEVTLPPYRIGTSATVASQPRPASTSRMASAIAAASRPLAFRPVPIAQTGS